MNNRPFSTIYSSLGAGISQDQLPRLFLYYYSGHHLVKYEDRTKIEDVTELRIHHQFTKALKLFCFVNLLAQYGEGVETKQMPMEMESRVVNMSQVSRKDSSRTRN
ncbi:hypothetical protein FGO68_gene13916 [Halteria grandinella]|uniref:Uncharacterized protein n=1 Tax=Halteria grandinella TaxID=5974 RepID=A0A8J8NEQ5_HALGN|nr:hypothetical protein FGO68_gene13916 [Halteria grandinella]